MRRTKNKSRRSTKRKGGSCACNKTMGGKKHQRGGQMSFDHVGMPSNAIPLNGHEVDPIAMQTSSRLTVPVISGGQGNHTRKRRGIIRFKKHVRFGKKRGGGIFSDWLIGGPSSTTQNAVVQFGTSSGAKFGPDVLSGASYGQTPYTDMRIPFKPMV
jgi:hypothetical protein